MKTRSCHTVDWNNHEVHASTNLHSEIQEFMVQVAEDFWGPSGLHVRCFTGPSCFMYCVTRTEGLGWQPARHSEWKKVQGRRNLISDRHIHSSSKATSWEAPIFPESHIFLPDEHTLTCDMSRLPLCQLSLVLAFKSICRSTDFKDLKWNWV